MDKFPRLFVLAAIGYLAVGALLGAGFSEGHVDPASLRFVHIHLGLLGFMAMFIYGVAYHILPRFNARPLKRPALMGVHFYLVNIGLIGMTGGAWAGGVYGEGAAHWIFLVSSHLEVAGILVFAYNVVPVMISREEPYPAVAPPPPPPPKPTVTPDMPVAEIIEKWPRLTDVLIESGFKTLAIPAARASFARTTTLEQACRVHRADTDAIVAKLNAALSGGATAQASAPAAAQPKKAPAAASKGQPVKRGEDPSADTLIGSLLEAYPETKPVFEKNYGAGCFSCPGQASETIAQTAAMHGMKTEKILDEINQAIAAERK